ncbi:hypothetical protein [Butyrivibrio sp. INlla16]|uniref:hypothetical protein n=1 Tax=Butyrivibrio sp. INlla16 TaxID=1520807 RepID=UPI00088D57B5|nr:hypothetical protein [Butyrivibrio sp. INlla16]SDB69599.1 hypothetical protein SAMN02910263_04477 [Butyrivibrio sp. INlla16]
MGLIRSGNTELSAEDSDAVLTEYLWPIVREIIKTAIENKQDLIVEECYVPFDCRRDFSKLKDGTYIDEINMVLFYKMRVIKYFTIFREKSVDNIGL